MQEHFLAVMWPKARWYEIQAEQHGRIVKGNARYVGFIVRCFADEVRLRKRRLGSKWVIGDYISNGEAEMAIIVAINKGEKHHV